jgi:molybdopterin synthase sulfur carrier subunit
MPEVKVFGGMRRLLGANKVDAESCQLRELLDEIAQRGGEAMAQILFADPNAASRETHMDLRVLVNGRNIVFLEGLDTRLREEDSITLHLSGARGYPGG